MLSGQGLSVRVMAEEGAPPVLERTLFDLASQAGVVVAGTNSTPGATRVLVNGVEAVLDMANGAFRRPVMLEAGFNRVLVEARDATDNVLFATDRDVIVEAGRMSVGGNLINDTTWSPALGLIQVTNQVTLAAGRTLVVEPATVILFEAGAGIRTEGGVVEIRGTAPQPVYLLPAAGTGNWAGVQVSGAGGRLQFQHGEMAGGALNVGAQAALLVEDSTLRDFVSGSTPLVRVDRAAGAVFRRSHATRFFETLWRFTPTVIEDSLFEHFEVESSDGIDFDGVPAGSVIRRCTVRHGPRTNTDAIDLGSGSMGILVEDCRLYGCTDKGVSIGEDSYGIVVSNCLIHDTGLGIEVKDGSTVEISRTTVAACDLGIRLRPRFTTRGGHITNSFDNLIWGNTVTLVTEADSTWAADHSLIDGAVVAGEAILTGDPKLLDPAGWNFTLGPDSPVRGRARDGGELGVRGRVGAAFAPSAPWLRLVVEDGVLGLRFLADGEAAFAVESAPGVADGWLPGRRFGPAPRPREIETIPDTSAPGGFFRVQATLKP